MIDINILKNVLVDSLESIKTLDYVPREVEIDPAMPYVFIGVRRCGKSYLLYQRMHELVEQGHSWDEFLYINFEDERLMGFGLSDFNKLLEAHLSLYQREPILFLDEVQIVEGWERFGRRVADQKQFAYITGSNSQMLSSEIAATLGGRYLSQIIYPYSFTEFLTAHGIHYQPSMLFSTRGRADIGKYFGEYFTTGGFPELTNITLKRDYLSSIYSKIFLGDIVLRYGLSNSKALEVLIKKLAESVGKPISFTRLKNIIKSVGVPIGTSTVIDYLEYAKESQLIVSIENYDAKMASRMTSPKYYFVDNGLLNLFLIDEDAALLENLVAIHLVRQYGASNVYFYEDNVEVDFYVPEEGLAIQACYSMQNDQTSKRETSALSKFADRVDCERLIILTYGEETVLHEDGHEIAVEPIWKWLLRSD